MCIAARCTNGGVLDKCVRYGFTAGCARRGDYRVILRLDDPARVVILHRVAHRAHVYRPG